MCQQYKQARNQMNTPKSKLEILKSQLQYHITREDNVMIRVLQEKIEKATRNKIKVNAKGKYMLDGLNDNEKNSLKNKRDELSKKINDIIVDDYIIALYNEEDNELYFVDESSASSDPRAEIY
jgi:hypothetical protein